jgi:DNA polymerase-3 subunit alpha
MERRDEMFSRVGQVIAGSSAAQRDRATGQASLFDMNEIMTAAAAPEVVEEERVVWSQREYLANEKELLGFYVTGHPLDEYRGVIGKGKYSSLADLPQMKPGKKPERFAGMIGEVAIKYTKREGKPFAVLLFEDFTGSTEVMVWNETYQKCNPLLVKGAVIELKAKVEQDTRTETNRLTADEIKAIIQDPDYVAPAMHGHGSNGNNGRTGNNGHHATPVGARPVLVELDARRDTLSAIQQLRLAATDHPGERPLHLRVRTEDGRIVTMEAGGSYRVSDDFLSASGIELWVV